MQKKKMFLRICLLVIFLISESNREFIKNMKNFLGIFFPVFHKKCCFYYFHFLFLTKYRISATEY